MYTIKSSYQGYTIIQLGFQEPDLKYPTAKIPEPRFCPANEDQSGQRSSRANLTALLS
jgi:hypothetical protein